MRENPYISNKLLFMIFVAFGAVLLASSVTISSADTSDEQRQENSSVSQSINNLIDENVCSPAQNSDGADKNPRRSAYDVRLRIVIKSCREYFQDLSFDRTPSAATLSNIANYASQLNMDDIALLVVNEALTIQDDHSLNTSKIYFLLKLGEIAQAKSDHDIFSKKNDDTATYLLVLNVVDRLGERNHYELAIEFLTYTFEKERKEDKNYSRLLLKLRAEYFRRFGQLTEAAQDYQELLETESKRSFVYYNLCHIHFDLDQLDAAASDCASALKANDHGSSSAAIMILNLSSRVIAKMGKIESAKSVYEDCLAFEASKSGKPSSVKSGSVFKWGTLEYIPTPRCQDHS